MDLEYTQQLETALDNFSYSNDENKSGWKFTLFDKSIIRFQLYGSLDNSIFKILVKNFEDLQSFYFKDQQFLVFLFDFSNFKKATSEVRTQIIDKGIFNRGNVSVVIYGMNYFTSTIAKVISKKNVGKRLFIARDEAAGIEMAKKLISNYEIQELNELQGPNYYSKNDSTIEIGGKPYSIVSRQAWTYNDLTSEYSYKIDLIDKNILISRPSGYIRYQNSVMANVLFDKVVNSEVGQNKKFYRIQDYTLVTGSENKARRDFNSYLLNGIDNIDLLIFYGLNRIMWTVVRLGKLVNPAYEKVRIVKTFEEALEIAINHKYKNTKASKKQALEQLTTPVYSSPAEEIKVLKDQYDTLVKENASYLTILFDRISKITFGNSEDYVPVKIDIGNPFYDLFSAVQLLYEDYIELKNDRNALQVKLLGILTENAREMKDLKIDNLSKMRSKESFIRTSGHELSLKIESILNAIQLLKREENPKAKKTLFEIIRTASIDLQFGIGQLKSSISEKHEDNYISESMFNYRKNIVQLIEIARMGHPNGNVIFENTVEEQLPSFLIGDMRKFNQLVNIYVENAIKYTSDGFIKIYTHVVSKSATQIRLRLSVEDSGIGIDKFEKTQIFKEEEGEEEGSKNHIKGFGLLIARNLARVLDADIGFESEKGEGSNFWVELTFNIGYHDKASQMLAVRNQRKAKMNKKLPFDGTNALVIIDDAIKQNLLGQILRGKGIQSRVKLNNEFFDDIDGKFDFVFVSLQLVGGKELSNFKLIKNMIDVKNNYVNPIYIGLVDSFIDPILEDYKRVGVEYFLHKSCNIADLDQFFKDLK